MDNTNLEAGQTPSGGVATPLTYGQIAVGITFNPSGDPVVTRIKYIYAEVIDTLNNLVGTIPAEKSRLLRIAITEAQTAQMWAVKAITFKEHD